MDSSNYYIYKILLENGWLKQMTKNIKIRSNVDFEWASSLFVQLYGFIYYWKIDSENIIDSTTLIKKFPQY